MRDACFALVWCMVHAAAKCATDAALVKAFKSFLPYNVVNPSHNDPFPDEKSLQSCTVIGIELRTFAS